LKTKIKLAGFIILVSYLSFSAAAHIFISKLPGNSFINSPFFPVVWNKLYIPFTGRLISYHDNGQVKEKGFYILGLPIGQVHKWDYDGQLNYHSKNFLLPFDTIREYHHGKVSKYRIVDWKRMIIETYDFHGSGDLLRKSTELYPYWLFVSQKFNSNGQVEFAYVSGWGKYSPEKHLYYDPESGRLEAKYIKYWKPIRYHSFEFFYPDGKPESRGKILHQKNEQWRHDTLFQFDTAGRVRYEVYDKDVLLTTKDWHTIP
jgi:hypothetical protein